MRRHLITPKLPANQAVLSHSIPRWRSRRRDRDGRSREATTGSYVTPGTRTHAPDQPGCHAPGHNMSMRARSWYRSHTFHHSEFPPERLAAERSHTVSVCLPARDEERTIGAIVSSL